MISLNRKVFFAGVRHGPFPGKLTQSQVQGMNDLLDAWERYGTDDPRHLAYTLATDYHETGGKMQPVREGFKASDAEARAYVQKHYGHKGKGWYCWPAGKWGHVYYGRGDVQLTWLENYQAMGDILKIRLAENPDLALQGPISKRILIEGMLRGASKKGDFTGKALEDYFNDTANDPLGARRIVNGTDKAKLIAGYYDAFLEDIKVAMKAAGKPGGPKIEVAEVPKITDQTSWGGVIQAIGGLAAAAPAVSDGIPGWVALVALGVLVAGTVMVVRGRRQIVRETGI